MVAHGRDLWTTAQGDAIVVAESDIGATVAFTEDRSLRELSIDPRAAYEEKLVGLRLSSGFRRSLDEAMTDQDKAASLSYQLLDDLPTAILVSGVALASTGIHPGRGSFRLASRADICAGWATGATIMVEGQRLGFPPTVIGPPAPSLEAPDGDPMAWQTLVPMLPHSTRRLRRMDVWRKLDGAGPDGTIAVEAFFRDSQVDAAGSETVVHEYLVAAELEHESLRFISCRAEIGVLPWIECPEAASSAVRLVGTTPTDLRERVRQSFVGTSTCTHLNDTLRALAALPFLAAVSESDGEIRT
ncbi:MAG TPA: DUF2889 domain-containing protein [Acidimicrobiales bacterium]|nr:DUF2889 domain-containing protein [Acidimicrobiales bacterium]